MDEQLLATPEVRTRAERLGLSTDRLPNTIDRDSYTPALLSLLSNMMVWGGSRVFRHLGGVGTNEWRIISALGNHPGSTASDLCEVLGMNKSIASKSVNLLLTLEFIAQLDGPRGSRHLYLTDTGVALHDQLMPVAVKRQEILHRTLSPSESKQVNDLLVRMLKASEELQDYEREVLSSPSGHSDAEPTK